MVSLAALFLGLGGGLAAGAISFAVIYQMQRRSKEALLSKQEAYPIA